MGCVASYWRLGSVAPRVGLGAFTPMLPSCPNAGAKPRVSAVTAARTDALFMDEPRQHRRCQSAQGSGQLEKPGLAAQAVTSNRGVRVQSGTSGGDPVARACSKFTPVLAPTFLPDARAHPDRR